MFLLACKTGFVLLLLSFYFVFFCIPGGSWRKNWRPFWCAVEASGKKEAFDLTDQVSHFLWHWDEDVISFKTQLTTPINPLVELRGMCSWLLHYLPSLPMYYFVFKVSKVSTRVDDSDLFQCPHKWERARSLLCWVANGCKLNYNSIQFLQGRI